MNKWNYQVRSHRPQHYERPLSADSVEKLLELSIDSVI